MMNRTEELSRRPRRGGLCLAASVGLFLLLSTSALGQVEVSKEATPEGRSLFGSIKNLFQRSLVESQAAKPENSSDSALRGLSGYTPPATPPTSAPPPPPPPLSDGRITLDFNTLSDGTPVLGGAYVSTEWSAYGVTLTATGGYGAHPRIFNTSDVGNKLYGDIDLGTPNSHCPQGGPGVGTGGVPGKAGENCKYLGNVLIVQEANDNPSIPDDSGDGGVIFFDFTTTAPYVYDMQFLDIDYASSVTVTYFTETGVLSEKVINLALLGDNAVSTEIINTANVKHLKVTFARSGAISYVSFIPGVGISTPAPVNPTAAPVQPTPAPVKPTSAPIPSTPAPIAGAPGPGAGTCQQVDIDFSKSADNTPLSRGDYVLTTLLTSACCCLLPVVWETLQEFLTRRMLATSCLAILTLALRMRTAQVAVQAKVQVESRTHLERTASSLEMSLSFKRTIRIQASPTTAAKAVQSHSSSPLKPNMCLKLACLTLIILQQSQSTTAQVKASTRQLSTLNSWVTTRHRHRRLTLKMCKKLLCLCRGVVLLPSSPTALKVS